MNNPWGNLSSEGKSYYNGILYHELNLPNLFTYIEGSKESEINEDSMLSFFGKDNLSKIISRTGNYIPHEIFLHAFSEEKIIKILAFIFNYLPVHVAEENKCYTYLHSLLSLPKTRYSPEFILKVVEQAKTFDYNFNYKPLDEIPIYNWVIAGRSYAGKIDEFKKLLPSNYDYYFVDRYLLNSEELIFLIKALLHNCHIAYPDVYNWGDRKEHNYYYTTTCNWLVEEKTYGEGRFQRTHEEFKPDKPFGISIESSNDYPKIPNELLFSKYTFNNENLKNGLYNSIFVQDFLHSKKYNKKIYDFFMYKLDLEYKSVTKDDLVNQTTRFLVRKK